MTAITLSFLVFPHSPESLPSVGITRKVKENRGCLLDHRASDRKFLTTPFSLDRAVRGRPRRRGSV